MILKIEKKDKDQGIVYAQITTFYDDGDYVITDEDQDPFYEILINEGGKKEIVTHIEYEDGDRPFSEEFNLVEIFTDNMVLIKKLGDKKENSNISKKTKFDGEKILKNTNKFKITK